GGIWAPGEGVAVPPGVHGDLDQEVGRGADPVDAEAPRRTGEPQRAIADRARAEERRRLLVRIVRRELHAVAAVGHGVLGEAAVDVESGEARAVAEVLASGAAGVAGAARPARPGNGDA